MADRVIYNDEARQALLRDVNQLAWVVRRHRGRVVGICGRVIGRPDQAEDFAQEDLVTAEERRQLTHAFDTMPDGFRVPLALRLFEDRRYKEIGNALDLSVSAVKMRIFRARRELRRQLLLRVAVDERAHAAM